jgi:hypothetical protein
MSLFDEEAKAYFLAAGYAVATIDVPCAVFQSFGCWRMTAYPASPQSP